MASLRREAIGELSVQHAWQLSDLVGMLQAARDEMREGQAKAEERQASQGPQGGGRS